MQVTVTARNLDLSADARAEMLGRLGRLERLLAGRRGPSSRRVVRVDVVIGAERNPRIATPVTCEVTVHAKGRSLHASASGADLDAAVDAVCDKLARQARTTKGKRTRRAGVERRGDLADGRIPAAF